MTFYLKCEENGYARFVDTWARLRCTNLCWRFTVTWVGVMTVLKKFQRY